VVVRGQLIVWKGIPEEWRMGTVVVFKLDDRLMAVRAENISRVIWAVEITAVPGQSKRVLGFIKT
jgi:chemotaxis signal transduction protein